MKEDIKHVEVVKDVQPDPDISKQEEQKGVQLKQPEPDCENQEHMIEKEENQPSHENFDHIENEQKKDEISQDKTDDRVEEDKKEPIADAKEDEAIAETKKEEQAPDEQIVVNQDPGEKQDEQLPGMKKLNPIAEMQKNDFELNGSSLY